MKKRPVLAFAMLAVGVYLVTVVALFPASLAVRWFVPAVPGLVLGPVEGSVWQGRVAGVEYRGWNPGNIEWTLHPLSLLTLSPSADILLDRPGAADVTAAVETTLSGHVEISQLRGAFTLADLEQARLIPANVASGEVIVNLPVLALSNGRPVAAQGRIVATNLQSRLLPGVSLGSYESELKTADNRITATFRDVEAPLRVVGQGHLQPDGNYSVTGSITPTTGTPDALRRGLVLLGQPDASGRYSFNFSGRL